MTSRRSLSFVLAVLFLSATILSAETVTLPVAASVVGQAPFVSDVRVFNTSYDDPVTVTATYRCTPGSPGCGTQPVKVFQLAVREARAFDDIVGSFFVVPNSLGAVEFDSSTSDLVVTSRLYSPASSPPWPVGTVGSVGMFIPGLDSSSAHAVTVLTNLANGLGLTGTFRTNVGVYNPNGGAVTATIRVYESGSVLLGSTSVNLGGKTGTQLSNIYQVVGFGSLATSNGYATVESDNPANPLFTYAATADNVTQDPVLVVGVEDKPAPAGFHPSTPTATATQPPASPTPTPTPTPTSPPVVVVNLVATQFQWTFSGNGIPTGPSMTMHVGQTYEFHIRDEDRTGQNSHGFSGVSALGMSAHILQASGPEFVETVTPTADLAGRNLPFNCTQSTCGTGHDGMLGVISVSN